MAITFFGESVVPTDGASATNTATQNTITPPSSMLVGDLVIVLMQQRGTATMSIGVTGGQTWFRGRDNNNGSTIASSYFWCRYNGTWGANPRFDFSAGTCTTVVMLVFRPSDTLKYWGPEIEAAAGTFTAGTTPFTKTITGVTTSNASTVTLALWMTADDNTWGSLSGTGWSKTGLTAQYRNTSGSDQSMTVAYNIKTSAGATNNVSQNQATLGGDAGITYLFTFYERDTDYLGYTAYGNANSAFDGTGCVGCKQGTATYNARGAIVDFYATSTGGANTMYAALYKVNGSNYEYITSGSIAFNSAGYYKIIMPCDIINGTEYFVTITPNNTIGATFQYSYFPGIYDNFAFTQTLTYSSGVPTWPSTISVASPSGGYFPSNCSVSLRFATSLGGGMSDSITDNYNSFIGKAKLNPMNDNIFELFGDIIGNTLGPSTGILEGFSDVFSDGLSNITGRLTLSGYSDSLFDSHEQIVGKYPISAISDSYIDASGDLRLKGVLSAIGDSHSDSNIQMKGRVILSAMCDSMGESFSLSVFKTNLAALGDSLDDTNSQMKLILQLAGISESFHEALSGTQFKAFLEGSTDSILESYSESRLRLLLSSITDSNSDAFSNIAKLFDSSLPAISESWADSYAVLTFRAPLSGISESILDSISGMANVAIVYAGELRKCVGGVLVLADLPSIYNNKNIAGKKLYIYRDGQMQEIKTLSS